MHYLEKAENLRELQILFRISMQLLKVLKTLTWQQDDVEQKQIKKGAAHRRPNIQESDDDITKYRN